MHGVIHLRRRVELRYRDLVAASREAGERKDRKRITNYALHLTPLVNDASERTGTSNHHVRQRTRHIHNPTTCPGAAERPRRCGHSPSRSPTESRNHKTQHPQRIPEPLASIDKRSNIRQHGNLVKMTQFAMRPQGEGGHSACAEQTVVAFLRDLRPNEGRELLWTQWHLPEPNDHRRSIVTAPR